MAISFFFSFDPRLNEWISVAPMINDRSDFFACSDKNKIFVFGGKSQQGPISKCEQYDPSTNCWTEIAELPIAIYNCAGMVTECGKILLSGGFQKNRHNSTYNTFLAYCPEKVTFIVVL